MGKRKKGGGVVAGGGPVTMVDPFAESDAPAPPPETTPLSPDQETKFQAWAKANNLHDVDHPDSHYDYRGAYLAGVKAGPDAHWPDTFKQHGHPTFSIESKYAHGPGDAGHWEGDTFVPPEAPKGRTTTAYDAQGNPIQVSDADLPKKFMAGEAFLAPGQQVHVKDQRGRIFQVGAEQAGKAFESGMGLASAEDVRGAIERKEQNTFGKSAEALGVGAARGLTLGLSDPAAIAAAHMFGGEEAGKSTREHLRKLQEFHPIASTVGEVGGAVAPVLLSGGAGAAVEGAEAGVEGAGLATRAIRGAGILPRLTAHAGEAVSEAAGHLVGTGATGLLGRVAQRAIPMAAGAATEGAVYGAAAAANEAILGDEELTAEKLLSGAGHGAMLGAITGGVLGGGYELGKSAIDKGFKLAGKEGLEQWLSSVADNQTFRALGANSRDVRNLAGSGRSAEKAEERIASISDTIRTYKLENGERLFTGTSTTSQLADRLDAAVDEAGGKLGKFRAKVASIAGEHAELGPDLAGLLKRVDMEVLAPAREAGGTMASRAAAAEKELQGLARMGMELPAEMRGMTPEAADKFLAANPDIAAQVGTKQVSLEELTKARQKLDRVLYPKKVMGVQPPPVDHFELLEQARGMIESHIEEVTDRALQAAGSNEMVGAYKTLKDTFRNLNDAKQIAQASDFRAFSRNTVSLSDKMMSTSTLAGALASGANPIGAAASALGSGVVNHLLNERGNSMLAAAAEKASALLKMQRITSHVDEEMSRSITAFLNDHAEVAELAEKGGHLAREVTRTGLEKAPVLNDSRKAEGYEETVRQVAEHAANEAVAMQKTADAVGPIAKHAPTVANNVVQKLQNNVEYLHGQIPPQTYPTGFPLAPQPHATGDAAAKVQFMTQVRTVEAPVKVVTAALGKNALTTAHVKALRATSPKIAEDIEKKVMEGAAELRGKGKAMGYDQRLQAGILTGRPQDATATKRFMSTVDNLRKERAAQGGQPGGPSKGAPKRMLAIAGAHKSFSDRISGISED